MIGRFQFLAFSGLALLCLLVLAVLTGTRALSEMVITFDQANPPFMYDRSGNATGLYPAIIAEAFRRMNEPFTLRALPWQRALSGADAGHWGVGGLYMNQQRLWKYDYSEPIYEERLMVYALKGKEFPFSSIDDLTGKKVGVMRGWTYGDAFDQAVAEGRIDAEPVNSDKANIGRLLLGRVDAILAAPETVRLMLDELDPHDQIVELPVPMQSIKTFLSFPKSSEMHDVLKRFNKELSRMREDGTIDRLVREHMR
jgi:polar amino acid transport system substrate-binding protein